MKELKGKKKAIYVENLLNSSCILFFFFLMLVGNKILAELSNITEFNTERIC